MSQFLSNYNAIQTIDVQSNPFTATVPKLENITDKYKFISTAQFIDDVQSMGYKLEQTASPRRGLGMHSMSFSHPGMPKADGLDMRLLATNSHDATSAFRLYIQVLVQVCSNGLVAWQSQGAARVVHRGYAVDKVADAIELTRKHFDNTLNTVNAMQAIDVTPERGAEFLRLASELRDAKPYRILDLQTVRHAPQAANTAWNVFNRVQEAIVKGGYKTIELATYDNRYTGVKQGDAIPGRRAKELTAIKERVAVNTKLWELAVQMLLNKAA